MGKVFFVLGIHNHQPTGNFDHVFQWAYDHAYKPFLDVLKRYPKIKLSIHHSGPLLDWLMEKHPKYLADYSGLARDGRVEIMGGAYYEPILPIIPDRDKLGQLTLMKEKIKEIFGYDAIGVWVPERVWEPFLPRFIKKSGYEYVVLDDVHFLYSGLKEDDLTWFYTTEDSGFAISAFPDLQVLRYMIPFHTVEAIEGYFRSFKDREDDVMLVMADDGEKFGVWPGTYKHVYEEGWLDKFFAMLTKLMEENWFEMVTFKYMVENHRSKDRVYIPTASYIEMTEWVLPPDMGREFEDLVKSNEEWKPYLRGGHWRMFFSKYHESNLMKSRMLEASSMVETMESEEKKKEATLYLYKGQTNCAYWHGVFGGLYLPHLRRAIYENLVKAEALAVREKGYLSITEKDFDADGMSEIIVRNKRFLAAIDTEWGAIMEFDEYDTGNLINVMARYKEAYHDKVYEAVSPDDVDGTKTIHEVILAKEKDLAKYLVYDKWPYMAFMDLNVDDETVVEKLFKGQVDIMPIPYERYYVEADSVIFPSPIGTKSVRLLGDGVSVSYDMNEPLVVLIPISFYDPSIAYEVAGRSVKVSDISLERRVSDIKVSIPFMGVSYHLSAEGGEFIGHYPIFTVSNSESGFEKVYQGTVFVARIKNGLLKWGVHRT